MAKIKSEKVVQANNEKCAEKERDNPLLSLTGHSCAEGQKYIELFLATNIPHPIKTVTFRTVSGAPTHLTAGPRSLYSSFTEDEEAAYSSRVGRQQVTFLRFAWSFFMFGSKLLAKYYNDQYEGRQTKYGRDWGEPARTTW
ncbi:unnamed protein product [Brugia pahangi]|uniref:Autophagy-related protein n=1 Tax=Brugia pahangi TaxID=6280 RepID=A0A0N4T2K4_BRUPA|nr:unnamed protein product [Brugia pahangi]